MILLHRFQESKNIIFTSLPLVIFSVALLVKTMFLLVSFHCTVILHYIIRKCVSKSSNFSLASQSLSRSIYFIARSCLSDIDTSMHHFSSQDSDYWLEWNERSELHDNLYILFDLWFVSGTPRSNKW
jgi:hypothetical protein